MIEFIYEPWPWYVAGPLIGLVVPLLFIIGNKSFGISSSLRHICAACIPANIPFFNYEWKKERWNLFFISGILIGGVLSYFFLLDPNYAAVISPSLITQLKEDGLQNFSGLLPIEIFSFQSLTSFPGFIMIVVGGFLIGFGTRYGGGCTSGHAILGLSTLQWPSLVATCCFMAGGIIMSNVVLPFLLKLF
ncbi:MAG TPA: YeeE/YedE thiosulfate transporter family protein [Bacteroidia bacterium]|nr:YeeE/YedE thiosulfate transporter family protein [Bacteroidia bacterium]